MLKFSLKFDRFCFLIKLKNLFSKCFTRAVAFIALSTTFLHSQVALLDEHKEGKKYYDVANFNPPIEGVSFK